jgi:ribosomal protein L3 glutamine methyltransferase
MSEFTLRDQLLNLRSDISGLHSIRDFIRWGASRFSEARLYFGHGTDNALDEAAWLVLHALSLPPDLPEPYYRSRLTVSEKEAVVTLLLARIETRKPAAYLTGEAWFCDLTFSINESVLVPRSPIAELIQSGFSPWLDGLQVRKVLDLCTGSGCIGIACAYAFPEAQIGLADISDAALEVARGNIRSHGLEGRVIVMQSNVFEQIPVDTYDLIVANPPYVANQEMETLPDEFLQEPSLGLIAGEDGLDVVQHILVGASNYLTHEGVLIVEVGNSQTAVIAAWPDAPFTWLNFERGGEGVFIITSEQLRGHFKSE